MINSHKEGREGAVEFARLGSGRFTPSEIAALLYERGIMSVMVEGGTNTLQAFLNEGLFDEITEYMTHTRLGSGVRAPNVPELEAVDTKRLGNNLAVKYAGA